MNEVLAGLVAALPLAALGIFYMSIWGPARATSLLVAELQPADASKRPMFTMLLVVFALAPFALGAVAGLVYVEMQSAEQFFGLALSLAMLFSLAAMFGHTPMKLEKVVMNFVMALVLGTLVPLLVGV